MDHNETQKPNEEDLRPVRGSGRGGGLRTGSTRTGQLRTGEVQGGASGIEDTSQNEINRLIETRGDALAGKFGTKAQIDAIQDITAAQVETMQNRDIVSSGDGSALVGFGNFKTLHTPKTTPVPIPLNLPQAAGDVNPPQFWDITVTVPEDPAEPFFVLAPNGAGIAPAATVAISEYFPIVGEATEFIPADGNILYIETTKNVGTGSLTMELKYDPTWTDIPLMYKIDTDVSDNDFMFRYFYPLYFTVENTVTVDGPSVSVGDFILQRLVPNASLQINNVFYRNPDASPAGNQVVPVVDFTPSTVAFFSV